MNQQSVILNLEEHEVTIKVDEGEYQILYADFSISAVLTRVPAQLSGPPENCHPDESEIDIVECKLLRLTDEDGKEVPITPVLRWQVDAAISPADFYDELWDLWESEDDRSGDEE